MPSRRDLIKMTDEEVARFLDEQKIVSCATLGPSGRPHLVALWYVAEGGELRGWTYAKSQKAKNLERDPRATLQVEDGVLYHELRGVMLECDVDLEHDDARVAEYGRELFRRYTGTGEDGELAPEIEQMIRGQASKRVGLRFTPTRTVSWDHGKLVGAY
jgi:PPOX class probable F420-dependent enzyme